MLVFKKNWLYKYNEWCSGNFATLDNVNDSKSICPYFWKSLWNLFGTNTIYLLLAHVPLVAGMWISNTEMFSGLKGLALTYTALLVGYILLILFFFVILGFVVLQEKLSNKIKSVGTPSNNVVVEYIKAKKSKICPMIKWED
ncbi:hypothetical protein VP14_083 [Vibrio phage VPMCC14]|nr:hypothetical protein VP14_083 [Vibrio phage VPMCC14]